MTEYSKPYPVPVNAARVRPDGRTEITMVWPFAKQPQIRQTVGLSLEVKPALDQGDFET